MNILNLKAVESHRQVKVKMRCVGLHREALEKHQRPLSQAVSPVVKKQRLQHMRYESCPTDVVEAMFTCIRLWYNVGSEGFACTALSK